MNRKLMVTLALTVLSSTLFSPHALGISSNPTAICAGSTCTVSFPFTGDYYTWTAPASLSYTLEVWGAQGGNPGNNGTVYSNGGKGGFARGLVTLTAGQVLAIYVGGQGLGETTTNTLGVVPGGFNGGGDGYNGDALTNKRGGGGGGASDIRLGGTSLSSRIIVAGGGGGGGYFAGGYGTVLPGVGGGSVGGDGATSVYNSTNIYHGKGGTQIAGGAYGSNGGAATAGSVGFGGAGVSHSYGSGGGGGGYFGGGGSGGGMGSGGGSGYVGGVTASTLTAGDSTMPDPAGGTMTGRTGHGFARITYTWSTASISLAVAGGVRNVTKGQTIGITATIDSAGKVTFFADGKKIPGCISVQASIGNKSCNWKPSIQKSVILTARIDPSGAGGATSAPVIVSVTKRKGTR